MESMGHDEPAKIARARGVQWAHEVRTIIIPSSMEWPWSAENGIELARQYVRDLADDPTAVESLAAIVLHAARQSWTTWRSESSSG